MTPETEVVKWGKATRTRKVPRVHRIHRVAADHAEGSLASV